MSSNDHTVLARSFEWAHQRGNLDQPMHTYCTRDENSHTFWLPI